MSLKIFFCHVPKTAGTSIIGYLHDQFPVNQIFSKQHWFNLNSDDLVKISTYNLVAGHFDLRMLSLLGNDFKKVTILRDPIDRCLSSINHSLEDNNFKPSNLNVKNRTVKDIIHSDDIFYFSNIQTNFFSSRKSVVSLIKRGGFVSTDSIELNYDLALSNLKGFDFIGFVDSLHSDLFKLGLLFNFELLKVMPLRNQRDKVSEIKSSLSSLDFEILEKINHYDIKLFNKIRIFSQDKWSYKNIVVSNQLKIYRSHDLLATPFTGSGFWEAEASVDGSIVRWAGPDRNSYIHFGGLEQGTYLIDILCYFLNEPYSDSACIKVNSIDAFSCYMEGGISHFLFEYEHIKYSKVAEIEFISNAISFDSIDLRPRSFLLLDVIVKPR